MTVHITLFNGTADARRNNLLAETFGKGILDSACTKTVAGNVWLVEFLATLSSEDLKMVKEKSSKAAYLFGDGIENRSEKCVTFPDTVRHSQKYIFLIFNKYKYDP